MCIATYLICAHELPQARAGAPRSVQQGQLERWVGRAAGLQLTERVLARGSDLAVQAMAAARMNVACFQEASA